MPLPLIPIAIIGVSAIFGAKKAYDTYSDSEESKRVNKLAQDIYNDSLELLDTKRKKTNKHITNFGSYKMAIFKNQINDFLDNFKKIKNFDFNEELFNDKELHIDNHEFEEFKNDVLNMTTVLGSVAGATAGAVAGFGAYGSVGLLATASTGTAISTLSGVAATNATLAWLGGGSLASGGLGMAGGMYVLGGLVAGPALAVATLVMASSAEKAKNEAYNNLNKAKVLKESNNTIILSLKKISKLIDSIRDTIKNTVDVFNMFNPSFIRLVNRNIDYATYDNSEKELVHKMLLLAQTIKNIIVIPLLDEEGEIDKKCIVVNFKTKKILSKIKDIEAE
ncbi:hypothetical protein [Campylobacter geochelonis]|uniref:Uncharacterized protein n=1 Tax=Campylobacter geochelonis TaxID=1780362 RepID=A0A128EJN8_9BACT|nr:hypothetical protein [Campylobacter geochelonis]QKF71559.1 putative membrane protein [Campylobacter geochelonis]CZE49110.1 Uncharacterised protein [Campylobacter geochelonis]